MTSNNSNNSKTGMSAGSRRTWYPLDLSAIVYPTLQRRDFSSLYRLSVLLKEPVRPDILQQAVDIALKRFPTYKTAMRRGLFWRFLEPNDRPGPFVAPDISNPCMPLNFHTNNRYALRVYYYDRRISLECHHSLGDGTGSMHVLMTITAVYLRLLGHSISCGGYVLDTNEAPDPEELEDAYLRYATAKVKPPRPSGKTYLVRGTKEPFYTLNVIDGIMPVAEVKAAAARYQVTITEYLNAVLLYALLQKQLADHPRHLKPVRIAMPVNLRQFFPSKTLRNFISMVYPGIDPRLGDYTFEEIVTQTHHFMRYAINPKFLNGDITTNIAVQKNTAIRIVPLFIKDFVVRRFYRMVQDHNSSAGLTNMGIIKLPADMTPLIDRCEVYMGQPFSNRTNCAIASFNGQLTINFNSSIKETDVERLFFRKLIQDGIPVKIESNRK
ncbi:MAG: alcohol acetyltransferase [Lachnospiraceae bacterium]|nr:alcohol acetyltransferase [Lachnospiraceae bacterium]